MIRPTRHGLLLLALGIPLAALPIALANSLWPIWFVGCAATLLALGLDAVLGVPCRSVTLDRQLPPLLHVGRPATATFVAQLPAGSRPLSGSLLIEVGKTLAPLAARPVALAAAPGTGGDFTLCASRRGRARVEAAWLRWPGRWGLTERVRRFPLDVELPVTPDIPGVRSTALRFFANRQFLTGIKIERYRGEGSEFDSLREFQPGFDPRALDWRASARHRKLVCREFRAERNHQLFIAVDCGHRMREPVRALPKIDHAIHAGLLLAYVGLKSGDLVGWLDFDDRLRRFQPPRRGMSAFPRLQHCASECEYSDRETNFALSMAQLGSRLRRRSLVVLITDFSDPISAELMVENVGWLARRHILLFVALRGPELDTLREARPADEDRLLRAVIADRFIGERQTVLERLRQLGILCIDCLPEELSAHLVNRYLDIRRRELVG